MNFFESETIIKESVSCVEGLFRTIYELGFDEGIDKTYKDGYNDGYTKAYQEILTMIEQIKVR